MQKKIIIPANAGRGYLIGGFQESIVFFSNKFFIDLFIYNLFDSRTVTCCSSGPIEISSLPVLHAQSAIVIDSDNDQVLWSKNADEKMYPASTTKLMTAIVVLENIKDLDEIVTISKNASGRLWSKFAFQTGDRVSARDL
ncbi:MAG: D-alanyl-D-alanine carboxypeptidase [Actinomycetota bacterium]|nr:D-alanyl-D-alanine carboxypeptidase [Actinomycetota bacterium]